MPTDTKLKELIINELTEEQYKALTPNDDELYLTPDGSITKNENGSYVFNDGLEVKSNGDVTVGKNLEVDGTAKLNGGLKAIATYAGTYKSDNEVTLYDFGLFNDIATFGSVQGLHLLGFYSKPISYEGSSRQVTLVGFGIYGISSNEIEYVEISGFSSDGRFMTIIYAPEGNRFDINICAYGDDVNLKQDRLYVHTLTLTASDKTYILVYGSTNNLNCDSIADLRTIMKISSTHDSEVLPLCSSDMTSTACLKVTTSVCQIGTNNVTAVADSVDLK